MSDAFKLRDAVAADVAQIVRFIRNLAQYEKLEDQVEVTEQLLADAMFGPRANLFGMIADVAGVAAGYALYFYNFSSFVGRRGLYLEDLYVDPGHRRHGLGKAMFQALARRAVDEGCGRFEWAVLNWNAPALKFYKSIGAVPLSEWQTQRLAGEALHKLANTAGAQ
ncbi:MAG: GNAT family N-acetyltransferase [Rhodospirillaceae bacterium]|nr:GNAT family N-acetyltransferase [Rhodospirillaceae bacterium]